MIKRRTALFILAILSAQITLGWVYGFSGDQISDPISTNAVTIDGKWTNGNEWSDAVKVDLTFACGTCSGKAYVYTKHDTSCFYFLIDFVSATSLNSTKDGASLTIDSAHDGGNVPNPDDRRFDSHYPSGGTMAVGSGSSDFKWGQPLPAGVHMALSVSTSPNSATPHEISEFKISFSAFPNQIVVAVGFAVTAYAGTQLVVWPADFEPSIPTTWGELILSPTPIPEFQYLWLPVILSVLAVLVIIPKQVQSENIKEANASRASNK